MVTKIGDLFREKEVTHELEQQGKVKVVFDRVINNVLMLLMGIVVVMGIIELVYEVVTEIRDVSFLHGIEKMPEVLSLFLWVLIALELLDSVRTYAREHHFHVETVVSVAVIAVARKVIVLDLHSLESFTVLALAAVVAAVCGGYYLVRKSHAHQADSGSEHQPNN
jgi:uncharacterized membrane protein (DUF373 family)